MDMAHVPRSGLLHPAGRAQWTVIDPSNLVQNIKSAVQSSTTASNMIKSLQESVKIYNQSKAYYDALKSVHNIIKDARKVKLHDREMVSEITDIYMSGFNRMVTDRNFTPGELAAISAGYARLLGGPAQGQHLLIEIAQHLVQVVEICCERCHGYQYLSEGLP